MMQCLPVEGFNFLAQIKEVGSDCEGQQGTKGCVEVSPAASRVVGGRLVVESKGC